jgi:hypothetical protein
MNNEEFNDSIDKLKSILNMIMKKEYVSDISYFKRLFIYFLFSIFVFLQLIIYTIKKILFFQFSSIPSFYSGIGVIDRVIKEHLEI